MYVCIAYYLSLIRMDRDTERFPSSFVSFSTQAWLSQKHPAVCLLTSSDIWRCLTSGKGMGVWRFNPPFTARDTHDLCKTSEILGGWRRVGV